MEHFFIGIQVVLVLVLNQLSNKLVFAVKEYLPILQGRFLVLLEVFQLINGAVQRRQHRLVKRVHGQATGGIAAGKVAVRAVYQE